MIDSKDIRLRGSSTLVRFRHLPDEYLRGAIYIENEYHKKMNRYLRRWGWWLQRWVFDTYEYGYVDLTYLPSISKKIRKEKRRVYYLPYLSKDQLNKIPDIKTTDLLDYLEDPDDARFLTPGFLFHKENKSNGISIYDRNADDGHLHQPPHQYSGGPSGRLCLEICRRRLALHLRRHHGSRQQRFRIDHPYSPKTEVGARE